jgi:hypothetical protein
MRSLIKDGWEWNLSVDAGSTFYHSVTFQTTVGSPFLHGNYHINELEHLGLKE